MSSDINSGCDCEPLWVPLDTAVAIKLQRWPKDVKPVVSISLTVYNQKKFVAQAIESFLEQETTFPVEILINDDASTDGTSDIVKRYQEKYPSLIRVTCQVENQFSKGRMVNEFNFIKAKGDYVALCHGDDFWIDRRKLEKQVAVMKDTGASICGHPAQEVDVDGIHLSSFTGHVVDEVTKIEAYELIDKGGNMLPFGSIMVTDAAKQDMLANMPPVMFHSGVQMLGALRGGVAVMPDVMLAYRVDVPGSTTEIMLGDVNKRLKTTLTRVMSIKHLKMMYGKKHISAFDNLLSMQILPFLKRKQAKNAIVILAAVLSGQAIASKVRILFCLALNFAKKALLHARKLLS